MTTMLKDPGSGLMLPKEFVDQKMALKRVLDDLVDAAVNANSQIRKNYFLTLHMKFAATGEFQVSAPIVTYKLPPFTSNQFVFG